MFMGSKIFGSLYKYNSSYAQDAVKEVLKRNFSNKNTKITEESSVLIAHLLKMLTIEISLRACKQAKDEESSIVRLEHVENVLLHMMLDFP